MNVGNPYLTQADGGYRVLVPDAYRIGQTITLFVKRKGWAIATPVGGKVQLSKEFTSDIVLSPEASSEFLSPAQLGKLLESLPEKLKNQIKPDGKEGEADPTQVVREYATDHGLPEREVSVKVEELVKQYEQSGDLEKQCLASIYRKDLKQAAARCQQSATRKVDVLKKKRQEVESLSKSQFKSDRSVGPSFAQQFGGIIRVSTPGKATPTQLEEARRQLIKLTEEVVGEFKTTGDTHYANYQFDQALKAYTEGLSNVEKNELPTLWADLQWLIGMANWQIGIRTKDAAIQEHLSEAVNSYREAQRIYGKGEFPEAWAAIENNLGTVLRDQGTRTGGEAGTRLLAQAVAAYREALTVRTKEALPQQWAGTQNNLAKAALSLEDWPTAAESSRHVLTLYPDYDEAYQRAHLVYHERLFAYASAFEVTTHWLDRHPEDVPAQANFAEAHLTTGHFAEAERRLEQLLKKPDLDSTSSVGLRIVDMVTALALKKAAAVPQKLQELRTLVSQQPETFQAGWSFDGTAHYVQTEQVFARYRPWLMKLFAVVKAKDGAALLAALDRVQAGFTP